MSQSKSPRQATAAEAEAMRAVYAQLAALLDALREARSKVHHPQLLAVVNEQIDRQLAADDALRRAIVEYTGRPVEDPY